MNTKKIFNFFYKKLKNQYEANLYTIITIFNIAYNNIIDIKQYLQNLEFNNNIHNFIKQFNNYQILENVINNYESLYNEAMKCNKVEYDWNAYYNQNKITITNNQYMILFNKLSSFNEYIIKHLNFNYSLVIEFARNTIIGVINAKK